MTENVNPNRTPDNITYKRETLEQAYEKCFGQAVEEYNAKQKEADRRIDGAKVHGADTELQERRKTVL